MKSLLLFLPLLAFAQHPVDGDATISLIDAGPLCDGAQRVIEVHVDITGLTGQGGDPGLNAFSIHLTLSDFAYFVSAQPGNDPIPFQLTSTIPSEFPNTNELRLIGHNADPSAPNQSYHVATVVVGNQIGSVTINLNTSTTSLGSKVIGSSGPGPINFVFAGPITAQITSVGGGVSLNEASAAWLTMDPTYDVLPPFDGVDILDLVSLAQCAAP